MTRSSSLSLVIGSPSPRTQLYESSQTIPDEENEASYSPEQARLSVCPLSDSSGGMMK